jgi:hypothetical protein
MTRLFPAAIAVVSALAMVLHAVESQKPAPKKGALPKSNLVYVKIIWPTDPATRDKDRPVVESWIAEQLKKRGESKFTAVTGWVPLAVKGEESTRVWNGGLDGKACACPVSGQILERADGRIKVLLDGWTPGYKKVTVSLTDEPGSREMAAVAWPKTEQGMPYVVVLIGPPGKERGKELAALEQKLVGAWEGQTGCAGNFLFRADGTYELKWYGPAPVDFAGTWKIRWNALSPTLVLTCKTSEIPEELGKLRLIQLDDKTLEVKHAKQSAHRYARVKK